MTHQSESHPTDHATHSADAPAGALRRERKSTTPAWVNGILAGVFLYLFLSAIKVMGAGLKDLGKNSDWLENILAQAHNPFVALMGSVLITSIVQSSSFTTSLIITLVAAKVMDPEAAIFAVMGANIGTSVTGIIVSLGNIRIRRQFRRAFTAALVHDMFNWLTVGLLFPLEWITSAMSSDGRGILSQVAGGLARMLGVGEMEKPANPIKIITKPVVELFESVGERFVPDPVESAYQTSEAFNTATQSAHATEGVVIAILGLVLLFASLIMLVANLKGALLSRLEALFRRVFFRNDLVAYVVGTITTILVQSSSVTTSLLVPLVGAGVVKIKRAFPFILGANLGTTVTGVIAAAASDNLALAVPVALGHVTFNLIGTAIWYPLRGAPLGISRWYAKIAARSRKHAFLFLVMVFIVVPLLGVVITEWLTKS